MGKGYAEAAAAAQIEPAIMHRIAAMGSAALDILPHNGAVIALSTTCGLTHKESYFDLLVVGSLTALVASLVVPPRTATLTRARGSAARRSLCASSSSTDSRG